MPLSTTRSSKVDLQDHIGRFQRVIGQQYDKGRRTIDAFKDVTPNEVIALKPALVSPHFVTRIP